MSAPVYLTATQLSAFAGVHVVIDRDACPGGPPLVTHGRLDRVMEFDDVIVPIGGTMYTDRGVTTVDLSCVRSIRALGTSMEVVA